MVFGRIRLAPLGQASLFLRLHGLQFAASDELDGSRRVIARGVDIGVQRKATGNTDKP